MRTGARRRSRRTRSGFCITVSFLTPVSIDFGFIDGGVPVGSVHRRVWESFNFVAEHYLVYRVDNFSVENVFGYLLKQINFHFLHFVTIFHFLHFFNVFFDFLIFRFFNF